MTSRDQGIKLRLDIYDIFTYRDSNIISFHRNSPLLYEVSIKVYKPGLDTAYKPNLDITQCNKYIFKNPYNININTLSYNFVCKYYGTPTTQPKDRK